MLTKKPKKKKTCNNFTQTNLTSQNTPCIEMNMPRCQPTERGSIDGNEWSNEIYNNDILSNSGSHCFDMKAILFSLFSLKIWRLSAVQMYLVTLVSSFINRRKTKLHKRNTKWTSKINCKFFLLPLINYVIGLNGL